jgi:hypothetical protein
LDLEGKKQSMVDRGPAGRVHPARNRSSEWQGFVDHLSQLKQVRIKSAGQTGPGHGMKLIFAGTPEFAAQACRPLSMPVTRWLWC